MTMADEQAADMPQDFPEGAEVLSGPGLQEAATLLALVQPAMAAPQWLAHLRELVQGGGNVCGVRDQGRLIGVITVEPAEMAWLGAWRSAGRVTGMAALPGPGATGRIRTLVRAATASARRSGAWVLLADPAPWSASVGFAPQAPIPYWSIAPETVRRFLRCAPLRPATEADLPAMAALYERRALTLGGCLRRTPEDWQQVMRQRSPLGPLHVFVTVTDGVCGGYVVVRGSDATSNRVAVSIDEWLDDGGAGLQAVVSFLSQLQGRAMVMQVPVPPDRPFAAWLTQPAPVSAHLHFGPCLAVADPVAVLHAALGDVQVAMDKGRMHLTQPEGMMSLAEPVLSALVAGSLDAATARLQGDLTGDDAACQAFVEHWPASPTFRFPPAGRRYP